MDKIRYVTQSEEETENLAAIIAKDADKGAVYCLEGELGAGKTAFARGFARGLGYDKAVTSPTFCILNEYTGGRLPVYHFDAYRVGPEDMDDICFPDYINGAGVCLIEWAGNISDVLPADVIWVRINKTGDSTREIMIC